MNHTPGPWIAEKVGNQLGYEITAPNEGAIARTWWVRHEQGEIDANASLIIAAPDLLAAAKALRAAYQDDTRNNLGSAWAMLESAIRKAETAPSGHRQTQEA